MPMPGAHGMMPETDHDEASRMNFVYAFKEHVTRNVTPGAKAAWRTRIEPAFQRETARPPRDRHEVHRAMRKDGTWQMFGSLSRLYQELKQEVGEAVVHRQAEDLRDRAQTYRARARHTTLRLDPGLAIPRYQTAVDIHLMPGGYHTERMDGDVTSGAIYDPGVYLFAMGALGPYNEDMGLGVLRWLKANRPGFTPRRILDMGCAVGHCTTPYADAFPAAEIHAIDVAAPVLRYAQARAESMGYAIHFSQQNAERTDFPAGHFDLIVSHILLHETSHKALYAIMAECHRLLSPGGIVLHGEAPVDNRKLDPFNAFMRDWSTHYNAEPFWGALHDLDLTDPATKGGFARDKVIIDFAPQPSPVAGRKLAGGAAWLLFGGEK